MPLLGENALEPSECSFQRLLRTAVVRNQDSWDGDVQVEAEKSVFRVVRIDLHGSIWARVLDVSTASASG